MKIRALANSLRFRLRAIFTAVTRPEQMWLENWYESNFTMPPPPTVKCRVLARYGPKDCTWIETGTFKGDTTAFLSRFGRPVFSIEPQPDFARDARIRFASTPNVTIIEGLSEDHLGDVLSELEGPVCLWLDGHFSGGETFKGPQDTPILDELRFIATHLDHLGEVAVLIDDLRLFDVHHSSVRHYPTRSELISWAEENELWWTMELDIFVARTVPLAG